MLLALLAVAAARGQGFTQRGFFEVRSFAYPQTAPGDSGRLVSEQLLRWEFTWRMNGRLQFNGGADARFDSHRQFERAWRLDWADRRRQRPALSVRRLSLLAHWGGLTLEGGRQFIRWGKADILNPTDRFAPKDFLNVLTTDLLGVTAVRATWERGGDTLDLVLQPVFTPSRTPLINQRWAALPEEAAQLRILETPVKYPGRAAAGARWNHVGSGYEFSLSFYDGFNHLPVYAARLEPSAAPAVVLTRVHPQMRMYGGDAAVPLRWATLKGEAAWFTSSSPLADDYMLFVIQAEKQSGEWLFVGGYAGEAVTERRVELDFAPDRGLAKTFLGRASYNIDTNRSVAVEGAVRQNGRGVYTRLEYTQAIGAHWRVTLAANLLRGARDDFLGQYRRNSNLMVVFRYSF
ncbi:MAG: hypothetical protein KatS3mg004_1821 [Bryobacteraceae bacterium]|nr:MAG: hypothetical protein KatS3mg004_1821 [Bryobacteraceae bacterium]